MCRPWREGKQRPQQCGGMNQPVRHHHIPNSAPSRTASPLSLQRRQFLAERAARKSGFLSSGRSSGPDTTQTLLHDEFAERGARCKHFLPGSAFRRATLDPGREFPRHAARRCRAPAHACARDDAHRRSSRGFRQVGCWCGPLHGPTAGNAWHGSKGRADSHIKRVAVVSQAGYEISEGLSYGPVVGTYP